MDSFSEVNEAIRTYVRKIDESSKQVFRSEEMGYGNFFDNKMLVIQAIRKGLPYELFTLIKQKTPFTDDEWAAYLSLSKKTMQRHSSELDFSFKPIHTEKILELAEVSQFGREVFDSKEQFYLWLKTPSYALGGLKPAELLKDSYGKEMVMDELHRIDHGLFG